MPYYLAELRANMQAEERSVESTLPL